MNKKMTNEAKNHNNLYKLNCVKNYMGGISYTINPIDTLKLITSSSICGEPQYYRDGEFSEKTIVKDGCFRIDPLFAEYSVIDHEYDGLKTSEVMEKVIDAALDYDFRATINWAHELRATYNMRLNPQVIMVRAAMHPGRVKFNEENPGYFSTINELVMQRADEPASQATYYIYRHGSKNGCPSVLKRNWKKKLESLTAYQIAKYKNAAIGMIDTVRLCHAKGPLIDQLMTTGNVEITENEATWENLRSAGKSWDQILATIKLPHMASLRNLRGIFTESIKNYKEFLENLKRGVKSGKQFPFRYYSAYQEVEHSDIQHKPVVLDTLEECMDIATENLPKLSGRTMCLSDNSGSAWGTCTSEYGSQTIATIGNLSSLITAKNSDEGYVGIFGDRLEVVPVSKRNGLLGQLKSLNSYRNKIGGGTENGIWLFFDKAIREKEHWDNIFIYSDMQAGHGGLYGTAKEMKRYRDLVFCCSDLYIDVAKLVDAYRRKVNPKVNVCMVQTAGYTNVLIPEQGYRTLILCGWTGNELNAASAIFKQWDEIDVRNQ